MRRSSPAAFTLVELLVVIAIMGLLLAILTPSLQEVMAMARTAKCASNLHQINIASGNYSTDRADKNEALKYVNSFGWRGALLPYLSDVSEALICPEGMYTGDTVAGAGYYVEVIGKGYNMLLEEEPLTLREDISDTAYLLKFEDIRPGGGDMDFNDLVLKIESIGDFAMRITYISINAGYHFNLRAPDGTVLMPDLGRATPSGTFHDVSGGDGSYGMTSLSASVASGSHMAYVLDYEKPVAMVGGNNASDDWRRWADDSGVPTFARHRGRCNVLFTGGSVRAVHHLDMDPDVPGALEKYWLPRTGGE